MSITKLSPNWACQMGPIHCPKFLLPGSVLTRPSASAHTTCRISLSSLPEHRRHPNKPPPIKLFRMLSPVLLLKPQNTCTTSLDPVRKKLQWLKIPERIEYKFHHSYRSLY